MTTPTIRGPRPAGAYIDECVADLRAIREQWGDLLAAIGRPPRAVWPPLECREWEQPAAADPDDEPAIGRMPLVLREHPAPANLTALDAAMSVEEALFAACDVIAGRVQRPVRRHLVGRPADDATYVRWAEDQADRDDPARWNLPTNRAALLPGRFTRVLTGTDPRTDADRAALDEHQDAEQRARRILDGTEPEWPVERWDEDEQPPRRTIDEVPVTSAGSRAHGLHWAAVWLEGRALNERHGDLFTPTPVPVVEELAAVARRARATVERALGRDGRPTKLDRPCPWCGGLLTAHTRSGDPSAAAIVCATGEACGAPVPLDRGRRIWRGTDRVGLRLALEAAQRRTEDSAA